MACVALTCLISTIEFEFLQPTPRVFLPKDTTIKSFFHSLSSLQDILQKESRRGDGGAAIKDLEMEIRDFALKAEDAIENQLSKIRYRERASQELQQTLRKAAVKAAELLNNILNSSTNTISNNEVDDDEASNESIQWSIQDFESEVVLELDGTLCHPPRLDNKMVGRDDDYATIKYQLVAKMVDRDGNEISEHISVELSELKLIWIVGMPGIGKTILATSVYQDPTMETHFDVHGWITMPKKYNQRQILGNLLMSIMVVDPSEIIKRSTPCELADQVCKCLEGKRFLIVLDNLWNNRAWDDIKLCFPDNKNGSRILLTTTHFDRDCYTSSYNYIHNMTLLNSTNSWDIFCNNILSLKQHMAPIFEKIRSRVIVEKCDGLPQLIVAVAKRLSTCNNIQREGKRIEKELDSIGILDRTALTFVFNQLPLHLNVCFLYLGVFPKRSEILVKMLIRLWVAEGFVKSEYEAYSYLQELIDRSFVLIGNLSSDRNVKTCRIHSSLHSFCVGEAQKEGFFCAVNTRQHLELPLNAFANSCRWLSFYTHGFDYYVLFSTNYSRSIFFFHDIPEMFAPSYLLRVLAFVSSQFLQQIPKHLHRSSLVFLRYLSVTQWFKGLDDIVSANPNLQTLIISNSEPQLEECTFHLPSTIWVSPQLRHLELGHMYTVNPPNVVKENLQTLSWLSPFHCRKEVFSRFPYLKKLKIFLGADLEGDHTLNNLDCMVELEVLTISVSVGNYVTLSEWSLLPITLTKLRLCGTNLSEKNLVVISELPNLLGIKLENAFYGKVWEVAQGGFPSLRFLLLEDKKLEQIMANEFSFRCLERLILRSCDCLKEIPLNFADIFTLQSIELDKCSHSTVKSAKMIQDDIQALGNEMFKVTILPPEDEESQTLQYTHLDFRRLRRS